MSSINSSAKGPKGVAAPKEKAFLDIVYDLFRSLKFTIFLLILLAILSILGTVIMQNAATEEYVKRYGVSLFEVLDFFGLFDMYHSWWFSAVLLLFVVNLITCSLHRLPGVWGQVFRSKDQSELNDSMLKILPYVERVRGVNPGRPGFEEAVQSHLRKTFKSQTRTETPSTLLLFSEKGRFSRLGVYIAHLSVLIILIGGLLGSLYGFKGFVNILEGESVDRISLRGSEKMLLEKPLGFSVRCDDFRITFYDIPGKERHVREYISDVTILENGKEMLKKTLRVNHPLHYKGLAFYQSSYGTFHKAILGIEWKGKKEKTLLQISEGETVPIPNTTAFVRMLNYAPQVPNLGEGVQVALFRPNQQPAVFWVGRGVSNPAQQGDSGFGLRLEEIASHEYTGLQVTKDPGVWIVWLGCGLMILGFILSFFFSHQRIWVRIPREAGGEIVLAGSTNKNRVGFEKSFQQVAEGIRSMGKS